MDYEVISTELSEMPQEQANMFRITGAAAMDLLLLRRDIEDQKGIAAYVEHDIGEAYLDELWDFPEGDQDLYVLFDEETPSSFPYGEFNLANVDVIVDDYRKGNPRKFIHELDDYSYMKEFLNQHLSTEKKAELEDLYDSLEFEV